MDDPVIVEAVRADRSGPPHGTHSDPGAPHRGGTGGTRSGRLLHMPMRKTWRADEFDLLSPSVQQRWSSFLKEEGDRRWFPNLLGIEVEELRRDYARLRMPWRDDLNQSQGLMHGGAISTLIDTAVVPAIGTAYSDDRSFSTIEISVRYVHPVRKEDLVAEGWVVRRGKRVVFCEVEVRTASGVTVATGDLIHIVGSPPGPES